MGDPGVRAYLICLSFRDVSVKWPSVRVCTVPGMYRQRVDFRLDQGLVARVDARAGELGQTRTRFVERALERALEGAPFPVVAENLAVDERGSIVKADPARPARYEEQRPSAPSGGGTAPPKIAPRHWAR